MIKLNKKFYIEFIFLVILGMVTSLSLPPFNYLIINFLTFSCFFLFLLKKTHEHKIKKLFFIYGWLFGFGYFATNLYWISISLTFDQNFDFLIPLTIILIPSFLALFYGSISLFFIILKPKNSLSSYLFFSLIFGLIEFIRGSILTGFPWNLIAYSFSNQLEILSITSKIGTYGFNLFCISLFTSPAIFILRKKSIDIFVSLFFLINIIFFYAHGLYNKKKFTEAVKVDNDYKVRVVGSNVPLERFYLDAEPELIIEDLIEISNPNVNEKTIFVWPEGMLPDVLQEDLIQYSKLFEKKFNENHFIIIGTNSQSTKNGSQVYFNSFSVYDNKLKLLSTYNKMNLVPFGEFLPLEKILRRIGLKSLTNNYQSFTSGDSREIIEIKYKNSSIRILPLICYEIIYSGKLFDDSNFDLIINISEDGWFGQSIGPKQHFVHSVFRAIESGKYLVRSANNGVAAVVNPLGYIEQSVEFGQSGYVELEQTKKIQPTIFSKYGNKIFGLLILLYIFLIFSFNKFRNE